MNEVKTIHLGRQQFTIAVDAHKVLREYLAAIGKQPGVQPEVVEEVEMRMAELLVEHGVSGDKVVLMSDVDFLKQQLGEPGDFKDETDNEKDEESESGRGDGRPRRFFRDPENAMLAGVASGLAAYTGIDATIIRIILVLSVFLSGLGILAYLLIWLLAPEAKTPSERLQMQGKAVTVDGLKDMVDRADIAGASQRAGRTFGRGLGRLVEGIFRIILIIIGSILTAAGVVAMLWTVASASYMLIHGGQVGTLIAFPVGAREVWLVILAALTGVIFGFLLTMTGIAMASRKWYLPGWSVAALIGTFLIAGSVGTALAFDAVPNVRDRYRQAHHSETRQQDDFSRLNLLGADTTYTFQPDSNYFVEFSYLGDVDTEPLKTTVENGTLTVDSSQFIKTPLCTGLCFYSDHDLKVIIHAPDIDSVKLDGTENVFRVDGQLNQEDLELQVRRGGGSYVRLAHIDASLVELTDDGNSSVRNLRLSGLKPDASGDDIVRFEDEDLRVHVDAADSFRMTMAQRCDENEPLVYLGEGVGTIDINGRPVDTNGLRDLRSVDDNNEFNCVVVR